MRARYVVAKRFWNKTRAVLQPLVDELQPLAVRLVSSLLTAPVYCTYESSVFWGVGKGGVTGNEPAA
jgi:hypothetical protein